MGCWGVLAFVVIIENVNVQAQVRGALGSGEFRGVQALVYFYGGVEAAGNLERMLVRTWLAREEKGLTEQLLDAVDQATKHFIPATV